VPAYQWNLFPVRAPRRLLQEYEGNSGYPAADPPMGYAYNAVSKQPLPLPHRENPASARPTTGEVGGINISNPHTSLFRTRVAADLYVFTANANDLPGMADIVDSRGGGRRWRQTGAGSTVLRQTTNSYFSGTGDLQTEKTNWCAPELLPPHFRSPMTNYGQTSFTVTDPASIVTTKGYDATRRYPVMEITGPLTNRFLYDPTFGARC